MATPSKNNRDGLNTRNVFLDTEVYRRYGHNLNNKVLQRLLQLTRDHVCTLHITDITMSEIKRQLLDKSTEVAQAVNKGNRLLRNWYSVRSKHSGNQPVQADVDADVLANTAVRDFDFTMEIEWEPYQHAAVDTPAKDIFDLYFRRDPPFDKTDSKEFPDAFVVAALGNWCQKNHQKMYVITRDKGMLRAVAQRKALLPLPTLNDYLALLVDDPKIVKKVERIFNSSAWHTVEESVREQSSGLGTVYTGDFFDGEVIHHEMFDGPVHLIEFDVISASDDQIEVVTKVNALISYEVQYLDTSSAWWDSEEHTYIGGEKEVGTLEIETVLSTLIFIDPQKRSITNVDLLTRDVNVAEPYEDFK